MTVPESHVLCNDTNGMEEVFMKKLLTLLLPALLSTPTLANDCKWDWAIDVDHWRQSYQVVESRMIKAISVVDARYIVFDNRKIVLDTEGKEAQIQQIYPNESLQSIVNKSGYQYIGYKGKITLTQLNGFTVDKDLFELITIQEFWDACDVDGLDILLTDKSRFKPQ